MLAPTTAALALCAMLTAGANSARGQVPVTWNTPDTIAGDADVATNGTTAFAYYYNGGGPLAVNGVTFTAPGADITTSSVNGPSTGYAAGLTGLSPNYTSLVNGSIWQSGSFTITLNGLTIGHAYLLQIWVDDSRNLGALRSETVTAGGNTSGSLDFPANAAGAPGQYVIGTFTAINTNEVLTMNGGAGGYAQVNAIQLRDEGASTVTATPYFSPPAGQYYGTQVVSVISQNGSTVFYTTDGSSPNSTSPHGVVGSGIATVNIPAPTTMTINAYATNSDQTDSAIATATYVTLPVNSGVWSDSAGGSWTNAANWANSVIADGTAATADFSQLSLSGPIMVTLDSDETVGNLLFDDQSGNQNSWTIAYATNGLATEGVLTLATSAGTPVISNNVATTIGAVIAGTQGLNTTGTGTLTFTNANTLSGGITVNGGSLSLSRPPGSINYGGDYVVNSGATLTLDNETGGTLDGGWGNPIHINGGTVTFAGSGIVRYNPIDMTGGTVNWSAFGGGFYGTTFNTYATNTMAVINGGGGAYGTAFTFNVQRGTAAIDLTCAMPFTSPVASVTLNGGGILEFTADNPYGGGTTINQGTLLVDNAIDNSTVTVNTNGILGGVGMINGPVVINDGGTLTVNKATGPNAVLGMLTLGNPPTLTSGSTIYLRISKTGGALGSDMINVSSGTLTYGGTLVVTNITSDANTLAAGDTFTLFNAGAYAGTFDNLVLPQLPAGLVWSTTQLGVTGTISVRSGVADVVFTPAGGQYTTAQSVTLSDPTPGATIYYTTDGTTPTTSSSVYTGPILVPVNSMMTIKAFGHLSGENDGAVGSQTYFTYTALTWINPNGGSWPVTTNWENGLVANSKDVTADFSTLTLPSSAYLTLDGAQTVGNLIFGDRGDANTWELDPGNSGSLTLAVSSGTPTFTVNNQTTILAANLQGTQGFIKAGAGTLQMVLPTGYTGVTTISNGTMLYDLEYFSEFSSAEFNIGGSGTLALHNNNPATDNKFCHSIDFAGSGTITKIGPGTLTVWQNCEWTNFSGVVDVQSGTLAANSMGGGAMAPAMTLNIDAGATFDDRWSSDVIVNKLTGLGTLTDSAAFLTFGVGNDNGSSTFGGVIQDTAGSGGGTLGLAKNGTGTFVLAGNNTYAGDTTVNGGVLLVNGSIGSTVVRVNSNGTLGGNGTVNGPVTIYSGGTLAPGGTNGLGTLTVNANVTMDAGANAQFTVGTSGSQLVVNGDLALDGTLNITAGTGFGVGTYTLATYTGNLSGNLNVGTIPAGYSGSVDTSTPGQVKLVVSGLPTFGSFGPLSGHSFPLTFSGPSGQTYKLLTSTNVALPLTNWTVLTTGTFGASPVTYTNTGATNRVQFYSLELP